MVVTVVVPVAGIALSSTMYASTRRPSWSLPAAPVVSCGLINSSCDCGTPLATKNDLTAWARSFANFSLAAALPVLSV